MAKMMSKDSQIILNMLRIQDDIQDILNSDDEDKIIEDKSKINLLTFYIVKLYALRKNFSGKTKKAAEQEAAYKTILKLRANK